MRPNTNTSTFRWWKPLFRLFYFPVGLVLALQVQGAQPVVAIHDSELTRALESMPASGATPAGPGTTGNQWWPTNWPYFVMPDSVKEMLRSDGTTFTVVGDSNIVAGVLTNVDGSPKYPIVISLASEAIQDSEIAPLTNYVAAGGFLFVGSSAFTRNPDGTTRTNFALASAMGVNMESRSHKLGLLFDVHQACQSTSGFSFSGRHTLLADAICGRRNVCPAEQPTDRGDTR